MIEVIELCKAYDGVRAADRVTFVAPDGAITGFVGPNGAGKSTVLRSIAQLVTPESGEVRIDGRESKVHGTPSLLGVYLSPGDLPRRATARGALRYVCDSGGMPYSAADEILELVGLEGVASRRIRTFSMGMTQRLGLAVALLPRARSLILDEPLNGLDPDGIRWIRSHLRWLASEGASVLLSSHVMSELAQTADRIVMLDGGKVVADGTLAEFVSEQHPMQVLVEVTDPDRAREVCIARGLSVVARGQGLVVSGAATPEVGRILFDADIDVLHLQTVRRSLEETYFGWLATDGVPE
ncbi:ABC transporter ATP-binding protein [Microbacterium sp. SA39]|uniref:ABC transporter ATP-binding protein n=1 Tax=Microbacterium sp. SA39 TaxID=1263625 RepID=UPI0005F9BAC8|nr:ATP-binding cassette domain-containing protein [Microbacterium sp. SA39]KJQ52456.1 putative ABC transporter ATP-binding protein YxlF [Microbacterium sp. SA39]